MTTIITDKERAQAAEIERLQAIEIAAQEVLSYMVGALPREGYLRDNTGSREALGLLRAAMKGQTS